MMEPVQMMVETPFQGQGMLHTLEFTSEVSRMARLSDVVCPTCKATAAMRISRSGFLQLNVLGLLGIYPWKCGACGSNFLSRSRRRRTGTRQTEGDPAEVKERRQA
jgi:ribosomal protein L37AE/L43A